MAAPTKPAYVKKALANPEPPHMALGEHCCRRDPLSAFWLADESRDVELVQVIRIVKLA
jgi:hypothetical protein